MTAATPCGCGRPVGPTAGAAASWASRARRERGPGSAAATSGSNSSDRRRTEGEQRSAVAEDRGVEASHADEGTEGDRAGCSSDNSRRTATGRRSGAGKRARSGATGSSGGSIEHRPVFFLPAFFPPGRQIQRGVSAGIKRVLEAAWFSRGRLAAAVVAAVLATAAAQEDGGGSAADTAGPVTVPLASAGLQYTADVAINSSATAALIVDTTVSIVAFPACGEVFQEDGTCIPYQDSTDSRWSCTDLEADGATVTLDHNQTRLENQEVSLADVRGLGSVLAVFNTTTVSGDSVTLEGWDGSAGVLGLAQFPTADCLSGDSPEVEGSDRSVFSETIDAFQYFALDLGDEKYDSTLEIGGYSGAFSGTDGGIQWGEVQTATFPNTWAFSAFDLSVCGRSMMSNVTAFWPAIVSTGSACLGLPEEFFDSLMAWLPVEENCPAQVDGAPAGGMCSLAPEDAAEELPSLSFRLSHHGQQLYIPLSSLLLDAEDVEGEEEETDEGGAGGSRRLCVTREESIRGSGWVFSTQPVVKFGTLPLRSLYTVVDTDAGRVGLAQKAQEGAGAAQEEAGNASCLPAVECVGMQSFQESSNACEGPACSSFFFTNLDEETMTCKSSGVTKSLAWVFGIFFGITEMAGHFLRAYYGATGVGLRGHQHRQGWEFHTGRLIESCLGKASRTLGCTSHERSD
eukprot:g8599.t1